MRSGDIQVAKIPGVENPADLLTKHLAANDMEYHMSRLGLTAETSRAATTPTLTAWRVSVQDPARYGALSQCVDGNGDEIDYTVKDHWQEDGEQCTRIHSRPRRTLFTPLRVAGAPPGKALTPVRTTQGVYLDDGEKFTRTDSWTSRSTAHMAMCRPWVGTTTFLKRSDWTSQ